VPHSWVDQIRSLPEVTLTARDSAETAQVHAGDTLVVSVIVKTTRCPAYAGPVNDGRATTSLGTHGPLGVARGVGVGDGVFAAAFLAPFLFLAPIDLGTTGCGLRVATAPDVVDVDGWAPTGCADGPPELRRSSRCAMPKTRPNATTMTSNRRVQ
jgi:hypothetical protein